MTYKRCLRLLIFLLVPLLICACASRSRKDFSPDAPVQRSLAGLEERIQNLAADSSGLSLSVKAFSGETAHPFWHIVREAKTSPARRVLITGGIHGNEPAGVETVLAFIRELGETPARYPNIEFHILPLLNPWGWTHNQRFNQSGTDINRDFASVESAEARAVRSLVGGMDFDLVVNHHEDPEATGFYMYQYARPDKGLCRQIIKTVRRSGFAVEQEIRMLLLKTEEGLIDAPMWGLWYMRLTRQLSFDNYCRLELSKNVFTIETATQGPMDTRVTVQSKALHMLIRALCSPQTGVSPAVARIADRDIKSRQKRLNPPSFSK